MGDKEYRFAVYRGSKAAETTDANITPYQVEFGLPNPLDRISGVDDSLKAGLRFGANSVRYHTRKENRHVQWLFACLYFGILWAVSFLTKKYLQNYSIRYFKSIIVVMFGLLLYRAMERYILLPRSIKGHVEFAQEVAERFMSHGWKLEFVVNNMKSTRGVVAYYLLTQLEDMESHRQGSELPDEIAKDKADDPNMEEWVSATEFREEGSNLNCFGSQIPVLLDGIPDSMKDSVDLFLWGSLVEGCAKVRADHIKKRSCLDCTFYLSAIVSFFMAVFGWVLLVDHLDEETLEGWGAVVMILSLFALVAVLLLIYIAIKGALDARVAEESYHPAMQEMVDDSLGPQFEAAGFRIEYATDDQGKPLKNARKACCLSGEGYLRFTSA